MSISSNTAHHSSVLMALGQVSVSITLFQVISNCFCVDITRSCNFNLSFFGSSFAFFEKQGWDARMEDLKAKPLFQVDLTGFHQDIDCGADSNSYPSKCYNFKASSSMRCLQQGGGQQNSTSGRSWTLMIGI